MKEKRKSKNWVIATTHWLTADVIFPLFFVILLGVPFVTWLGENNLWTKIIAHVASFSGIFLGTMFSAWNLKRAFVIKDSAKIINLSVLYSIILSISVHINNYLHNEFSLLFIAVNIAQLVIFYLASKYYIKNNA